jgi:hypothetical protein
VERIGNRVNGTRLSVAVNIAYYGNTFSRAIIAYQRIHSAGQVKMHSTGTDWTIMNITELAFRW